MSDAAPANVDSPVDDAIDPAVEAMIEKILKEPIGEWGVFTTNSAITAQAKKQDGNYRTVPLDGTEEFVFAGMRIGKRGKLIFEFRPIDPEYALYEWDETKVFEAVKPVEGRTFEEHIIGAMHGSTDNFVWDRPGEGFASANSAWRATFRKKIATEKKEAEAELVKANEERQESNPLWGMF